MKYPISEIGWSFILIYWLLTSANFLLKLNDKKTLCYFVRV